MNTVQTPLQSYEAAVKTGKLEANLEQEAVLRYLTQVQKNLIARKKRRRSLLGKLLQWINPAPPVQGLYLWGGVGIGKTMIMDFFYETLPVAKLRAHFHAFLQRLHQELREYQGQANPLTRIGEKLAAQYEVICFDEFFVKDVGDAILLVELFKILFARGVCLVATSNSSPDQLYENGLQRQHFLPVIALIHQHTTVQRLSLKQDYRRRALKKIPVYYTPLGEEAEHSLRYAVQLFTGNDPVEVSQTPLLLYGREIAVKQRTEKLIWFEFKMICGRPRSQEDYLALAKQYQIILVSNVPVLEKASIDQVISFIHLVDILYDARLPLIISAAEPIEKLYTRGAYRKIFQRTESRLIEMQTKSYLARYLSNQAT